MHFPEWADNKRMTKKQRASARLKFILMELANRHTGRASLRGLAEVVGLNHSTLCKYVKDGRFTESKACQMEVRLGRSSVTAAMLIDPLSIVSTKPS